MRREGEGEPDLGAGDAFGVLRAGAQADAFGICLLAGGESCDDQLVERRSLEHTPGAGRILERDKVFARLVEGGARLLGVPEAEVDVADALEHEGLPGDVVALSPLLEHAGERAERGGIVPLRRVDAAEPLERRRGAPQVEVPALEGFRPTVVGNRAFVVPLQIEDVAGTDQCGGDQGLIVETFLDREGSPISLKRGAVLVGRITDRRDAGQRAGNPFVVGDLFFEGEAAFVVGQRGGKIPLEIEAVGDVLDRLSFGLPVPDRHGDLEPELVDRLCLPVRHDLREGVCPPPDRFDETDVDQLGVRLEQGAPGSRVRSVDQLRGELVGRRPFTDDLPRPLLPGEGQGELETGTPEARTPVRVLCAEVGAHAGDGDAQTR